MTNAIAEASAEYAALTSVFPAGFVDRREEKSGAPLRERRQFTNSHAGLSEEAADLARAIDHYKAQHRRRFIDYEEMLAVVKSLGYSR
ncbi:hypothetical protein [Botrimarina hoheduenensis]|uniref:Uncharacterized protein n=1 Tax=Botrimarina hoheduenensis TaxID=2528000 RepID=A0A5C5VSK7_9BACT|nr:hypothetical protein [Botrimarina hoheduenensis]TWT41608.1 hypothetical protein Pla111_29850 [Botrimarina hoheduenensis]